MLIQNSAPNDSGLPALLNHIRAMQTKATRLCGLLETIAFVESEGACLEGRIVLTEIAKEVARELENGLDSVNVPEVAL